MNALEIVLLYLTSALLAIVIYLVAKVKKEQHEQSDLRGKYLNLESKIGSIELSNVESKLNPHLFKNILNSIQSHAYQTYFALDKLANVLDYILYDSRNKFVTPKEEIEFALNLIEINKLKISPLFEFKVKLKVDANDALYNQKVLAPLISIDLIENAFKHADLHSAEAFISIVFEFKNSTFSLAVSNKISSKPPLLKARGGIGSETLEQRLKLIYKNNFKLERFIKEEVYIANLKIHLREYQTQVHTS